MRGRYFHFDRVGTKARLRCLRAETAEELWRFEYATDYEDMYGYNNGPRCSPVVDDDRVYIFGAEGMLHCLDAETGDAAIERLMEGGEPFVVRTVAWPVNIQDRDDQTGTFVVTTDTAGGLNIFGACLGLAEGNHQAKSRDVQTD